MRVRRIGQPVNVPSSSTLPGRRCRLSGSTVSMSGRRLLAMPIGPSSSQAATETASTSQRLDSTSPRRTWELGCGRQARVRPVAVSSANYRSTPFTDDTLWHRQQEYGETRTLTDETEMSPWFPQETLSRPTECVQQACSWQLNIAKYYRGEKAEFVENV